jgi:hypothetical protein
METKKVIVMDMHESTSILLALQFAIGEDWGPVDDFKKIRDSLTAELELRGY